MKNFSYVSSVQEIFRKVPDSVLDKSMDILSGGRKVLITNGYIIGVHYDPFRGRRPDLRNSMIIYNSNGELIFANKCENALRVKDVLSSYWRKYNGLKNQSMNPSKSVPLSDMWLESVSGFLFGDVKPLSASAKTLRLLQLLFSVVFTFLTANSITIPSWLKLKLRR